METVHFSCKELDFLNYTYSNAIYEILNASYRSVEGIQHFTHVGTQHRGLLDVKNDTIPPKRQHYRPLIRTLLYILCVRCVGLQCTHTLT